MAECNTQLSFESIAPLPVTVDFAGGNLTTDSGLLLVRQLEDRMGLIRDLAACLPDQRDPATVVVIEGTTLYQSGTTYYQKSGNQYVIVNVQ